MTREATPSFRRDPIGCTLLGRYRVESRLGRGGMGTVFLALDEKVDRRVVVKVPDVRLLEDPSFRTRFELETRSLVELFHPNVVGVLDVGVVEEVPFLVLQYLPGGSLADRLEGTGGRQTPREILEWLPDIARTLDFVHGLGVVHRDVKPANILFDDHGHVYLADFGIAKALGRTDVSVTDTGMTPGTPDYMAPETALGAELAGSADQYALGAVVYRALAGDVPIDGPSPLAVLVKKQTEPPVPLCERVPDVPETVAAVVERALSRQPEKRYESCAELAAAFAREVGGETLVPGAETLPLPTPPLAPARRSGFGRALRSPFLWGPLVAFLGTVLALVLFVTLMVKGMGEGIGRGLGNLVVMGVLGELPIPSELEGWETRLRMDAGRTTGKTDPRWIERTGTIGVYHQWTLADPVTDDNRDEVLRTAARALEGLELSVRSDRTGEDLPVHRENLDRQVFVGRFGEVDKMFTVVTACAFTFAVERPEKLAFRWSRNEAGPTPELRFLIARIPEDPGPDWVVLAGIGVLVVSWVAGAGLIVVGIRRRRRR